MSAQVVVIGGGVAGLSAATALAERGAHVRLFEARPSAGGRCSAFTDPATGERVDNGQHVLIGCYVETFRFLRRIGAEDMVRFQPNLTLGIVDRAGAMSRLTCPAWPAPLHLLGGLLQWKALSWPDRIAPVRLLTALRHPIRSSGPQPTVRQWLTEHGQTPRLIELLWEPLAVAALNQPIDEATAEPFRRVVARMFTRDRRDATLGLPSVPLDELFVRPSQALLERRGGLMETSSSALVSVVADSGRAGVAVRDTEVRADAVVCAVPWFALPDVLPPVPVLKDIVAAARATATSPIVSVNLWLDRPVVSDEFVGLPGRHMQWIFDKGRLFGEGTSHLTLVSSGAEAIAARSNAELIALAMQELRDAVPAARSATVLRAIAVREKRATFSLAPGQPPRPSMRTRLPGLYLAGDWIDTGLPATIESAVESGHRAADAISEDLNLQ